jgi:ABC-type branched-subunit amino acid transport system substrate-binding protein
VHVVGSHRFASRDGRRHAPITRTLVTVVVLVMVGCSSTSRTNVTARSAENAEGTRASGSKAVDGRSGARASSDAGTSSGGISAAGGSAAVAGPGAASAPSSKQLPVGGKLTIGVHLSANAAAASAFGVALPEHSPAKVDAIVKWINANGGIGGRRVETVYHTTDPLRGSFDSQAQEACTSLTQDHHVDYAISIAQLYRDSLPACFAKNKTPFVWDVFYLTQRTVVPVDYLYRPAQPHSDRLGFVVDGLVKAGFFRNAKIGLLRYDSPKEKTVADRVFKPALAAHGLKVTEEAAVREPDSASQASDTAAASSSVALRFRQRGITHVLFVPSGGAIPLLFLAAAESQGFRPKYGFSSLDAPYFVRDSVPRAQLEGAMGVGWSPPVDLGPTNRDAQRFSPGSRLCVAISAKAGFAPDEAPMGYCDMLFFLKAALDRASTPTVAALRAGAPSASGYQSSLTFGTRFAPGRNDGTAKARIFLYDDDWQYRGAPYAIN